MAVAMHILPFLDGLSFLTATSSRQLLFRYYSYTNDEWRIASECTYSTDYTDIVSFALHHVSGGQSGKMPCSLCRHRHDARSHRIIRYSTHHSTCTAGPLVSGDSGTILMVNGDMCASLDGYMTTPIDHIWQFPRPASSLIMVSFTNMIGYFEVSNKGCVSKTGEHYIPLDYAPVIKCVAVHWKPKLNGRGSLCHTPQFIVSTSFNQLLIFEGGVTLLCIQLEESAENITVVKDSPRTFTVAVLSTNHDVYLYKITESLDNDAIYKLQAMLLKKLEGGKWLGMAAVHISECSMEQLLVFTVSSDGNPEFKIVKNLQNSKTAGIGEAEPTDNCKSLMKAARSLEVKKLHNSGIIEERRIELVRKCQVYCQAMAALTNKSSRPSLTSDLVTLSRHHPNMSSPIKSEVGHHERQQFLSLRSNWQRVVDEQVLTVGLLIDNPGPSVISDVSISLIPNKDVSGSHPNPTFLTKMVSLTTDNNHTSISHVTSSYALPPRSQACFIISSEDLLPYFIGAGLVAKELQVDGGVGLQTADNGWATVVILYKVDETSRQLGLELSQQNWNNVRSMPLESLLGTWIDTTTAGTDEGSIPNGFISMTGNSPTREETDLACHLGCKRLSKIRLLYKYHHYSLHTAADELIGNLPFTIVDKVTPTQHESTSHVCAGVCVSYQVQDNELCITVLHRSTKELDIVKNWIKSLLLNKWTFTDPS